MLKLAATLTVSTLLALSAPAFALGNSTTSSQPSQTYNSNPYSGVQTGTVSTTKQQRQQQQYNPYQNQYQPQNQYQNQYQPQQQAAPAEPTASRIRLSGSGNGTARQLVIESDPTLLAAVNGGQALIRNILIGRVDLNSDGKEEIFAYNENDQYCSGNYCPFSIYQVARGGAITPLLLSYMTVSDIAVMDQQYASGWRDIIVTDPRGRQVALTFDGRQYQEPRRSSRRGWR